MEHTLYNSDNLDHSESISLGRAVTPVRSISSESLLANSKEVLIQHRGELYHLRLTRSNKLILTK